MIRVLACLALLLPGPALADPDRLTLLWGSHHLGSDLDWQEYNPGLFLTWQDRGAWDLDVSLGIYQNSFDHTSIAAFAAWPVYERDRFEISLFAGLAHYPETGRHLPVHIGDVIPLGGVQARYGNLFAQVIPSDGLDVDAIITFGVSVPLSR
jgi:hypothetical protein